MTLFFDSERRQLGIVSQMLLLRFPPRSAPTIAGHAGLALLIIFIVLELAIGPRADLLARLGMPSLEPWMRISILMATALLGVRLFVGPLTTIGLAPATQWRASETAYLLLALATAAALLFVLNPALTAARTVASASSVLLAIAVPLAWGFYQELLYRGILQTALSHRFGSICGILIANLAFTFGPLHLYHLNGGSSIASVATMFAAIFSIGLVFGLVFARARNLWVVGILHGLGNLFAGTIAGG